MSWQKLYASDAIVYGLKETVNNIRTAVGSMLILLCEMLASLVVVGLPSLAFAIWKMPELRSLAIQIRTAISSGSYGSVQTIIKEAHILQIPLSVLIVGAVALCALLILWSMFSAGYIRMILKFHDTGSAEFRELCMGWHHGPRLLIAASILLVGMFIGLLLFVVPGIYILVHGILFPFFIIDKNVGAIESLKRSFNAVNGYSWQIVPLILIGLLANFNPIILMLVGFAKLLMYAHVYRRLTA